jgi:hypothetical protein
VYGRCENRNGSFTPQIGAHPGWTGVLLPDQIHFVPPFVVDLQDRLLMDGSGGTGNHQPSTPEFLGVREKLVLQVVTDVFFDENVVGIILSKRVSHGSWNRLEETYVVSPRQPIDLECFWK